MELSTNQGRALRKKGRMRLVRRSLPISQMMLPRLRRNGGANCKCGFCDSALSPAPRISAQLVRVPGTCCKQNS